MLHSVKSYRCLEDKIDCKIVIKKCPLFRTYSDLLKETPTIHLDCML